MSKIVEFKNVGMAIGEYEIEYDEDLPIKIEPKRGTLHPLNPPLKIELPAEIDSDDEADDDESVDSEASSAIARGPPAVGGAAQSELPWPWVLGRVPGGRAGFAHRPLPLPLCGKTRKCRTASI